MFKVDGSWGDSDEEKCVEIKVSAEESSQKSTDKPQHAESKEDIKKLSGRERKRRQLKNKRRCKNKFKKDNQVSVVKKMVIEAKEHGSEMVHHIDLLSQRRKPNSKDEKLESVEQLDTSKHNTSGEPKKTKNSVKLQNIQQTVHLSNQEQLQIDSKTKVDCLGEKLVTKLLSSRFRYINEQLYTTNSTGAQALFKNDPEAFQVYHQGFVSQVKKWPVNPLDTIIHWVKSKPQKLIIADFGCGEAFLAQSVKHKVHSFDLVAINERVTVCDISHVPLDNGAVDIVICCLSLMGTNCQDFVVEANRVLCDKGTFKVAEVASRFKSTNMFVNDMKTLGFTLKKKDITNNFFYMFEFIKNKSLSSKNIKQLKGLDFGACAYKKR